MTNRRPTASWKDNTAAADVIGCAHQAEDAVRRLAHLTLQGPALTPAEVDTVLSHLAETVVALPQVTGQLSSILNRDNHLLAMDGMTAATDPDLALDAARLHLDEARHPAVETYRRRDAARNEVAHINVTPGPFDSSPPEHLTVSERRHRPEDRQPLTSGPIHRPGPGAPRR